MSTTRRRWFPVAARILAAAVTVALCGVGTAPAAQSAPVGFPDLDAFTAVDAGPFVRPFSYAERWANGYLFFTTPDGISCAIGGSSWCNGPFPGLPVGQIATCTSLYGSVDAGPYTFKRGETPCAPAGDPVLNVGQKLTNTVFDITCAVGNRNLTACIDNRHDHGFVLVPTSSWTF